MAGIAVPADDAPSLEALGSEPARTATKGLEAG
jgi:hypothetical protein